MKIVTASTLGIAFLLVLSFQYLKASKASVSSPSQITQPSPSSNQPSNVITSPTPSCSPQPSPLSENEKYDPMREQTLENLVNGSLGTPDFDCDGICNFKDNCLSVYNPNQKDSNDDGKGDACDPELVDPSFTDSRCDMDGDGVADIKDNCPDACNPDQKTVDVNDNKVNDLCDPALRNFAFNKPCVKRKSVKAPRPPKPRHLPTSSLTRSIRLFLTTMVLLPRQF